MNQPPLSVNGSDPLERMEAQLAAIARAMPYPPTPDIAAAVMTGAATGAMSDVKAGARRIPPSPAGRLPPVMRQPAGSKRAGLPRLAWAAALALVLAAVLLSVPAVRAGLLDFLQIGAVRIQVGATATPPDSTAAATPVRLESVFDLAGQTTLDNARQRAGFPVRLPAYPPDLGEPDDVFMQFDDPGQGAASVVLVWRQAGDPTQARLSLHALDSRGIYEKYVKSDGPTVELTLVNNQEAVWTTGPYVLRTRGGRSEEMRLIDGYVLIWLVDGVTYRLETDLSKEEAIRIAESLQE